MTNHRQIYVLNPRELDPETIAVTFAKTSRSPQSFRDIAKDLTTAKSSEFHEKWVVGYGHASVAEHAVLHLALENVSRLAVETVQSCRLASYTEKSTRYQKWDKTDYHIPEELTAPTLLHTYTHTIEQLFNAYHHCLEVTEKWLTSHADTLPDEDEAARKRHLRTEAIDSCRFLLPAASLANVGLTMNARALEGLISKMLSHPFAEVRSIGREIKAVAQHEVPTLVKYAAPSQYLETLPLAMPGCGFSNSPRDCQLLFHSPEAIQQLLSAALFRYQPVSFEDAQNTIKNLNADERTSLLTQILSSFTEFELPIRETEYVQCIFELIMDQGAYYEFKRHRMMTLTPQELNTRLGYCVPALITNAGCEESYCQAMNMAEECWQTLHETAPQAAAYCVPNGYKRRMLAAINLRSLYHLIRLRTRKNAHYSIRRAAFKMAEQIIAAIPETEMLLNLPQDETWQSIEQKYFSRT